MRVPTLLLFLCAVGCNTVPHGGPARGASQTDRPIEEITYVWDGSAWETDSRVHWTYDRAGGEPTRALTQSWQEGAWSDVSKEEWALDAEGRQTTGIGYAWTNGGWSERMRMTFFYDKEGRKQGARRQSVRGGEVSNADSLASTFTEEDLEVERRFFRWADGAWREGLRQTSAYEAAGREVERVHLAAAVAGLEEQRRWSFTYDEAGIRIGTLVEQVADGAWTPWLNQTYAYDTDGKLAEIVHEEWDGAGWTNMMRNETHYGSVR